MAAQSVRNTQSDAWGRVDARSASGAITSTETGTALVMSGEGWLDLRVSALDIASNDEYYSFKIEANTRAATTTWKEIGSYNLGALEVSGDGLDSVVHNRLIGFVNDADYQVRLKVLVGGTSPSITFTAHFIPEKAV